MAFSETAGRFIGNLGKLFVVTFNQSSFFIDHFALMDVLDQPSVGSSRVPAIVFCVFQLMFAAITWAILLPSQGLPPLTLPLHSPMIAVGAVAERSRLGPLLVFVFVWSTLVYDPIACWAWNPNGWSAVLGGLDFAGGTPVHISSGTAALAISLYLGKRRGYGTERLAYKPHNTTYVILGTVFLWFGWFGFNGGSALSANYRAAEACIVTNLAASVGGLTWMLWVSIFFWEDRVIFLTTFHRIGAWNASGPPLVFAPVPSLASLLLPQVLDMSVPRPPYSSALWPVQFAISPLN